VEDQSIIDLYFARDESAISKTDEKYGRYLNAIAYRILASASDAEECVSDTLLQVWESIPPERPRFFKAFLSKITRSRALDRADYYNAEKRNGKSTLALEELEEAIPAPTGDESDALAVRVAINGFLSTISKRSRIVFLRRYFYFYSTREIALSLHLSEGNVRAILHRTRCELKLYLEKEGITL